MASQNPQKEKPRRPPPPPSLKKGVSGGDDGGGGAVNVAVSVPSSSVTEAVKVNTGFKSSKLPPIGGGGGGGGGGAAAAGEGSRGASVVGVSVGGVGRGGVSRGAATGSSGGVGRGGRGVAAVTSGGAGGSGGENGINTKKKEVVTAKGKVAASNAPMSASDAVSAVGDPNPHPSATTASSSSSSSATADHRATFDSSRPSSFDAIELPTTSVDDLLKELSIITNPFSASDSPNEEEEDEFGKF